jgi:hypothetical protein
MEISMIINYIMCEADALHTGEVVGSIPTAPTIESPCKLAAFYTLPLRVILQFAAEHRSNMQQADGEYAGTLFFACSRLFYICAR